MLVICQKKIVSIFFGGTGHKPKTDVSFDFGFWSFDFGGLDLGVLILGLGSWSFDFGSWSLILDFGVLILGLDLGVLILGEPCVPI